MKLASPAGRGDERFPFSILKRIVMGETRRAVPARPAPVAFSILKRIVMGETRAGVGPPGRAVGFQYPQADRDG